MSVRQTFSNRTALVQNARLPSPLELELAPDLLCSRCGSSRMRWIRVHAFIEFISAPLRERGILSLERLVSVEKWSLR